MANRPSVAGARRRCRARLASRPGYRRQRRARGTAVNRRARAGRAHAERARRAAMGACAWPAPGTARAISAGRPSEPSLGDRRSGQAGARRPCADATAIQPLALGTDGALRLHRARRRRCRRRGRSPNDRRAGDRRARARSRRGTTTAVARSTGAPARVSARLDAARGGAEVSRRRDRRRLIERALALDRGARARYARCRRRRSRRTRARAVLLGLALARHS